MNSTEFHHILPYIPSTTPNLRTFTDFLYSLFSLSFSPDVETTTHTSHPILEYLRTILLTPSPFLATKLVSKLNAHSVSYIEYKTEIPIQLDDGIQYFTAQIFVHTDYEIDPSMISTVFKFLHIFTHLYPEHMTTISSFCLIWVPMDEPKELEEDHIDALLNKHSSPPLSALHVNSAFTQYNMDSPMDVPSTVVFLYRNEDALKTILHEMFHALRIDGNIMSPTRENETYAETWARLLYIGWLSYSLDEKQSDEFHTNYITLLAIETAYSRIQAYKIYSLGEKAYSNTNAFQYYVDTYHTLDNIEGFLKWCQEHNNQWMFFGGQYECDDCLYRLFSVNERDTLPYMDVAKEYKLFIESKREENNEKIDIPEALLKTMRMMIV